MNLLSIQSFSSAEDRHQTQAGSDLELLGERLRRLRQHHGMSLRRLAKNVGVTATALHLWESGRRNPRDEHLRAFASAFRLTPHELLAGTDAADAGLVTAPVPFATDSSSQALNLAALVASYKEQIAAVAGIPAEKVRIIIEV